MFVSQLAGAVEYMDCISNECSGYVTKKSDGEAPVMLEILGILNTPSLLSHPDPLWPGVVVPDRILSKGQLELFGPAVRVFANGPGDLGSIPGRVIPKTLKMVLDTTLLNTQHYKVRFKGKVEQSWEWSSALPYTLV